MVEFMYKIKYMLAKPIRNKLCLYFLIAAFYGCGANTMLPNENPRVSIPLEFLPALGGGYFKFDSTAVGRPFHIYIRLPQGYDKNTAELYPTVYILDGDSLFPILAANHLFLNYDDGLPEAIVVGIAYGSFDPGTNKRGFDFSAPASDASDSQGGAPEFHKFLKLELLPEVERRYLADPRKRILFGQSRGGYMVLYSAFSDPDLFWGRIASNPSFNPGRKQFFSSAALATQKDLRLVVTSGSRDYPSLRKAMLAWSEAWQNRSDAPWAIMTATIDGGTHAADALASYRFAMNWLFSRG